MVLIILGVTSLIFYGTTYFISENFKSIAYKESFEYNNKQASEYATLFKTAFNRDFIRIRSVAQLLQADSINDESNYAVFDELYNSLLNENKNYLGIWHTFELSYLLNDELAEGRVLHTFTPNVYGIQKSVDTLGLGSRDNIGIYTAAKDSQQESIGNPIWYTPTGKLSDKTLKSTLVVPMIKNGIVIGAVGLELDVNAYIKEVESLLVNQEFEVILFSNSGDIFLHPNHRVIGDNISSVDTLLSNSFNLIDKIQSGEKSSFVIKSKANADSIYNTLSSFKIAKTSTPWALLITAPLTSIESGVDEMLIVVSEVAKFGVAIIILAILIFAYRLTKPLKRTTSAIRKLAAGDVHNVEKVSIGTSDETKDMAESTNILIDGLNRLSAFAQNIGKGNFNYDFNKADEDDILSEGILEMRNSLAKAREEEKQRLVEEEHLNWASQGINKFNRVLRVDNQNLEDLAYQVVETLTNYMGAHMSGIYLKVDEKSENYELISHIGFPKEKYNNKIVKPGDTQVGLCILEKDTIFINDVPDDADLIVSGLGRSKPASILIVPLISNLEMVGVVEIESLKQIEPHQISFVEKIAESIASTFATVKVNVRTAQLLDKSQKQAEELEQQEEEMRQNMEEMQATQEEASKKERELEQLIAGFEEMLLIAEYDYYGKLINVNENYLKILKLPKSQVLGKIHKSDVFMEEKEQEQQNKFWEDLKAGMVKEQIEYYKSGKTDYWIQESFLPVKSQHGLVQKVICVGIDITNQKKTESEIQRVKEGFVNEDIENGSEAESEVKAIDFSIALEYIDLTYLKMLYKKDAKKIYNILNLYSESLPSQLLELDDIAKARDFKRLKSRITGLRTKMGYLGLKVIYEDFRSIEKMIDENKNLKKVPEILEKIKTRWASASKELDRLLN